MKPLVLLLLAGSVASATNYSYSIYNSGGTPVQQSDLTNWNTNSGSTNGTVSCGGQGGGCPLYSATAGSLIYTKSSAAAYEVAINLDNSFVAGGGGVQIPR